ncbi:hypothetical protein A3C26_02880 [Candidatus Daviesbacteria bacterium RIFCSPHIGHO2_02_FULL_39_12]|uniref:Uncharacterized protein n=1 Tax=Candidatus Daviesbacteria bacterium RIFCSPHIGHO2_02_FULL_39_12 TaxID=1797770 RepID=A0A1F5JCE5_9BACT|nr:MAG: hypothetical protein A3C26_02880 [Candidatus Daviesbacteria bacterium RIFCSPHIGHO2_02_FULL_39_12]
MEICIYWDNWVKKEFAAKEKLEIVQSERVASAGGRKGGLGGIPPAEPSQFRSDIFKQTPPSKIVKSSIINHL